MIKVFFLIDCIITIYIIFNINKNIQVYGFKVNMDRFKNSNSVFSFDIFALYLID